MSGHQPFSNLTANFSRSRKAKIAAQTEKLKSEMALTEYDLEIRFKLRASRGSTEKALLILDKLKQDFRDTE